LAAWRQELSELPDRLARLHPQPFSTRPRPVFERQIQALLAQTPAPSEEERIVQTAALIASLGDSHTELRFPPHFKPLPLGLYWFEEGAFALAIAQPHQRALGCRLIRVEDTPIEEAASRLSALIAGDNEAMRKKALPYYITLPPVLRSMKILDRPSDTCRYTFVDARGAEFTVTLRPTAQPEVVQAPRPEVAPQLGKRRDPYWMACLNDVLYLNIRQCRDNPDFPFDTFIQQAAALGEARGVRRMVVDLRENGGGSTRMMQPLIRGLRRRATLNEPGSLAVLIGRRTFSSAMIAAIDMKQSANAVLIGEPTSGKPNHFGQVDEATLPHTGWRLSHSTTFIRTVDGDPPALMPDHAIPLRVAPYLEGIDEALQAALRLPSLPSPSRATAPARQSSGDGIVRPGDLADRR
jgi:C-terminal processing protease CtpA/Prc